MSDGAFSEFSKIALGAVTAAAFAGIGWVLRRVFTNSILVAEDRAERHALKETVLRVLRVIEKDDERQREMAKKQTEMHVALQGLHERLGRLEDQLGRRD